MIWVVAGTRDARMLIDAFEQRGHRVVASVVSDYGEQLLRQQVSEQVVVHKGALNAATMDAFIDIHPIRAIVDASHPYAQNVSQNLIDLAKRRQVPYMRYERPRSLLPENESLHLVADWSQCLRLLGSATPGSRVFLATGSRRLPELVPGILAMGLEPFVRILPDPWQMSSCFQLGLRPHQVIAMQGPFSEALNRAMFKQLRVRYLITKDSGSIGGAIEKIRPALDMQMQVIVVDRPPLQYPAVTSDMVKIFRWAKTIIGGEGENNGGNPEGKGNGQVGIYSGSDSD